MTSQEEADALLAVHQARRHLPPAERLPDDPNVRVGIEMPASLLKVLRDHARARKTSVSRLCREGACREVLIAHGVVAIV